MSPVRIRYQTIEFGKVDIHLRTLRDLQEFEDDDAIAEKLGISSATWSMFGVVWPSSVVLARYLSDYAVAGRRTLEVGCGIGVISLLLNQLQVDITATDHHPEAGEFLRRNVLLNNGRAIPFVRTGWADDGDLLGRFDLIVGSDLLYEAGHVELLAGFVERHANPSCEVIIIDPGRGNSGRFSRQMAALGYSLTQKKVEDEGFESPYTGRILQYKR